MSPTAPTPHLLDNLQFIHLPEQVIPLDAIVLLKALDEDGVPAWYTLFTQGVGNAEAVGALNLAYQLALDAGMSGFMDFGCDHDDDDEDN